MWDAEGTIVGFVAHCYRSTVSRMQLIQIGEPLIPTIQQLIDQMAARQSSEIEELKQAALAKEASRRARTPRVSRRTHCKRAA